MARKAIGLAHAVNGCFERYGASTRKMTIGGGCNLFLFSPRTWERFPF